MGIGATAGFGARRARTLLADASTPAYRTVCKRGAGTDAARRLSSESGSMSTATVPSEKGFFSVIRTRPSGPRVTRSCATAGRNTYFSSASRELEKLKNGSKADVKTVIDGKRGDRGALPTEEDLARVRKAAGGKEFQSAKEIKRTS